jgi:predicted XRE-type DNA-binding protein
MTRAASPPSYRLTFDDAVQVWLRHWSGEIQSRIAASFDVNQGRVNEVLKGHRHAGSKTVALRMRKAA